MITEWLWDLARRFILFEDESIVWSKEFADGPGLHFETDGRSFTVELAKGWLRVEQAPWLAAVVVATRDDVLIDGPSPTHLFLMQNDGTEIELGDPAAVAALGSRLHRDELYPVAYAELLVHSEWPGGWRAQPVTDPMAWRLDYPAEAKLPAVEPIRTTGEDGGLRIRFFGSRETTATAGSRRVL